MLSFVILLVSYCCCCCTLKLCFAILSISFEGVNNACSFLYSPHWCRFSFVIAFLLLLTGSALNDRHGVESMYFGNYYCYVVKPGVFAGGAVLSLASVTLGIFYYLTLNSAKNSNNNPCGNSVQGPAIAMGQPQFPPQNNAQDPVFVHEDTYMRRQFTWFMDMNLAMDQLFLFYEYDDQSLKMLWSKAALFSVLVLLVEFHLFWILCIPHACPWTQQCAWIQAKLDGPYMENALGTIIWDNLSAFRNLWLSKYFVKTFRKLGE